MAQESTWTSKKFWCQQCNRVSFRRTLFGKVCEATPPILAAAALHGILGLDLPDGDVTDHFSDDA